MSGVGGSVRKERRAAGALRWRLTLAVAATLTLALAGVGWGAGGYDPAADMNSMANTTAYSGATAWWAAGYTGAGVDVAVIDTGVSPVEGLASTDKLIYGRDLQPSKLSQVVINLPDMETQQNILRRIDNWKNETWVAILDAAMKLKKDSGKRVAVTDMISFLRRWHLPGDPQERSPYFTYVQPPKLTPQRGAPSVGDLTEEALLPHIMELSPHQLAFLRQFLDDEMQQMGRKTPRKEN